MRVFIAVELPDDVRRGLKEIQRDLRSLHESARWVSPESIHITLKFLGEVPNKRVDNIHEALAGLSWKPFLIKVQGIGFFPGTRSPRVIWAGMEAPTMSGLAEELDARMDRIGFEKERRAFRPHITLARARDTRMDSSLVKAAAKYADHPFGSFKVDRVSLFQSTLKPTGAVYNKLKEYLLKPRSHSFVRE